MSSAELRKLSLQQTREAFQRREGDCGSSEVQGACTGLHSLVAACHDTCRANATVHVHNLCDCVSCRQQTCIQRKLVAASYRSHFRLGLASIL